MPGSPRISRRSILQSGGAAAACAVGASQLGPAALAQGSASEPRGAAHHRFSLGSREVFVLSDGHMVIPAAILAGNVPQAELSRSWPVSAPPAPIASISISMSRWSKPARLHSDRRAAPAAPGNRPPASSPTAWRRPASSPNRSARWW